jgi:uncharacterized membrane protein required for colicin V production
MTMTDMFLLSLTVLGALYGGIRGIRPSLYLLVTFLAAILSVLLLTGPLENLILDLAKIGSGKYPDAPAVAVLILEEQTGGAYLAAMIPTVLTAFWLLVLIAGGVMLGPMLYEASRTAVSRILGTVSGLMAGACAALLVIVQLVRLPWPPAAAMFRGSLITAALNHATKTLIPILAGGA